MLVSWAMSFGPCVLPVWSIGLGLFMNCRVVSLKNFRGLTEALGIILLSNDFLIGVWLAVCVRFRLDDIP